MVDAKSCADAAPGAMSPGVLELSPQTATDLLGHLREVRAMLRSVIVAEAAIADHSIIFDPPNNGPDRWSPVLGAVCARLQCVRDIVCATVSFNGFSWYTFIALAEAIDAALWHSCGGGSDTLDSDELVSALRALVAMLDEALEHCVAEGLPTRAKVH